MTIELITPEENRILLTTLGNWDSDGYWTQSGFPEIFGLMEFDFAEDDSAKQANLTYPFINAAPGYYNNLQYMIYKKKQQQVGLCSCELTDGIYSFIESTTPTYDEPQWGFSPTIKIPSDWIKENTTLILTFNPVPGEEFQIACSRFSSQWSGTPKPQYLLIMGVG
jgi:hypothetical protein